MRYTVFNNQSKRNVTYCKYRTLVFLKGKQTATCDVTAVWEYCSSGKLGSTFAIIFPLTGL